MAPLKIFNKKVFPKLKKILWERVGKKFYSPSPPPPPAQMARDSALLRGCVHFATPGRSLPHPNLTSFAESDQDRRMRNSMYLGVTCLVCNQKDGSQLLGNPRVCKTIVFRFIHKIQKFLNVLYVEKLTARVCACYSISCFNQSII